MTQIIGVIALDPFAGKAYASQVRQVFGSTALVRNYSIMDGSVGQMDRCDLYMISTDALDAMKKQGHYLPDGAQAMEIQVTYRKEAIIRLREIPKGTTVQRGGYPAGTAWGNPFEIYSLCAGVSLGRNSPDCGDAG